MTEKFPFRMDVECAASLNIGENQESVYHLTRYKTIGTEVKSI